jgi:hypothetical protein
VIQRCKKVYANLSVPADGFKGQCGSCPYGWASLVKSWSKNRANPQVPGLAFSDLIVYLRGKKAGDKAILQVQRGGQTLEIAVVLSEKPIG